MCRNMTSLKHSLNGGKFEDNLHFSLSVNYAISIKILLMFVPNGAISSGTDNKSLSKPILTELC